MTLLHHDRRPGLHDPALQDADALIEEARKRHRRRRRWILGVLLLALICAGVVTAVLAHSHSTSPRISSVQDQPKQGRPFAGRAVALEQAGPLAVSPAGELYIADERRHEVLVRLGDGQFRVVAGDGTSGIAGNGGPATRAELSKVSDLAFGPHGDLYIADGARVQVVDGAGTIHTVAGGGGEVPGLSGTPALSASLGPQVTSIAFSPTDELYLATPSQLFRLTSGQRLRTVRAIVGTGPTRGRPHGSVSQLAVGGPGGL
jgi:glucose/arabinose dehydrogenase